LPNLSSDSLLRHLAKHGSVFKPNPSGRSKRACITCHAGKIKCDGNEKCSTCIKKGLECKYRSQDEIQSSASPVDGEDHMTWQDLTSQRSSEKEQEQPSMLNRDMETFGTPTLQISASTGTSKRGSISNGNPRTLPLASFSLFKAPNVTGLVDWAAIRIRTDSDAQNTSPASDGDLELKLDTDSERYLELYYLHFHHRWPIFHRPSLDEEDTGTMLTLSMVMIGAWLEGSLEARKRALHLHEKLVGIIRSQLVRIRTTKSIRKAYADSTETVVQFHSKRQISGVVIGLSLPGCPSCYRLWFLLRGQ
jgi:hypothetical protein